MISSKSITTLKKKNSFLQQSMITKRNNIFKQFELQKKIGQGSFAQVFKVKRRQDNQIYALKKIRLTPQRTKDINNALNQIRILASINSPFVIAYKDAFFDEIGNNLCIVMQYAQQGDLANLIETHRTNKTNIPEETIWKALYHLSKALQTLHKKKILHRDIKCANVLISEGQVFKLADLNVSKVLKEDLASTQIGTPYYASPEIWKGQLYDQKSDIWSLGCIIFQMAALNPPFNANNINDLYRKVMEGRVSRIPSIYSNDLNTIIRKMIQNEPVKRPKASQILNSSQLNKNYQAQFFQKGGNQQNQLMQTMAIETNIKLINKILPKSKYVDLQKSITSKDVNNDEKQRVKFQRNRINSAIESLRSQRHELIKKMHNQCQTKPRNTRFSYRGQKNVLLVNITNKKRQNILPPLIKKQKIMNIQQEAKLKSQFNQYSRNKYQKQNEDSNLIKKEIKRQINVQSEIEKKEFNIR